MSSYRFSLVAAVLLAGLSACKQGEGDRCEIDDDCGSGLLCEANLCRRTSTGTVNQDASTTPFGRLDAAHAVDASSLDAPEGTEADGAAAPDSGAPSDGPAAPPVGTDATAHDGPAPVVDAPPATNTDAGEPRG